MFRTQCTPAGHLCDRPPGRGVFQPVIIRICERQGIPILANRAYQGAGPWATTPVRRPHGRELSPPRRTDNRVLSTARAPSSGTWPV